MASARPVVPAPRNTDEEAFAIGETLTVFEAAMVYAGRHPHSRFLRDGSIEDYLEFLRAGVPKQPRSRRRAKARRSWDIYCELIRRIELEIVRPVKRAFDEQGKIDPVRTVIQTADLMHLATERRERPRFLRQLLTATEELAPPVERIGRPALPIAPKAAPRRRGPAPGTVNRYGKSDRAVFPLIKRLIKEKKTTAHAAALELAREGKLDGTGTSDSRARRVASRFLRENQLNLAETNSN